MTDPYETKHLSEIIELILAQINHVAQGLKSRRDNVLEARRSMSKATGIIRDFDDIALLTMFATEVAQVEEAYGDTSRRLQKLQRLLHSPYFARIDFKEDDYDLEEIYIGRHSLMDEKTHTYHIYDWRAPISSMYYDYGVGRASFIIPPDANGAMPPIEGEITLKRQFQIENGELIYSFDSDLAVEDDILRLELSKISDAKIKTIIHSIQKEQNAAIRSEAKDVLVFGPAGSGKTSVGLHRLAYLLYRHRDTLSSAKVRIFSPSPIFASYIEGIIPDLGEDDVETLDFPGLMGDYLPGKRAFHDQYQQIEHLAGASPRDLRRSWLMEKYSADFLQHLEDYIKNYTPSFEAVRFNRDILCTQERLAALYTDRTTAGTLSTKTARIITHVNQRYDEYFQQNKRNITELFNQIHEENFSTGDVRRLYEEERSIVLADLRGRLMPRAKRIYEKVLTGWSKKQRRATGNDSLPIGFAKESMTQEKLYFEDALMLMYIDILTGRIPQDKQVKHILLDEAQDICILQHRILRRLFTASHFTVLGDTNQALYPGINVHIQSDIEAEYPKAQVIPLTTSYRSTYEISRFAAEVLADSGDADLSSLYMRRGDEPAIIESQNTAATVWDIINDLPNGYNTVGILLTTVRQAKKFHEELQEYAKSKSIPTPIKLIADTNASFAPGIMVMALPYAKGLEFDAVICPEYGQDVFKGPFGRKMLYLTCTRALHRLYLVEPTQPASTSPVPT
ncbi:MAG: UvrD-helicase domain-containing protein [Defluviitaleaceae bacterium]|nr:UvrD-helicase domain-containing protein [Defluviitaleaceae bacterium]